MRFDILTIFPEAVSGFFSTGILGQARSKGLLEVHLHDLRDFTDDPHRTVDDRPYGGGPGMDDPNNVIDNDQLHLRTQATLQLCRDVWEQVWGFSFTDIDRKNTNDLDPAHPLDLARSSYEGEIVKFDWQHNLYLHETNTLTLGLETEEEMSESFSLSQSAFGTFITDFGPERARTNSVFLQDQVSLWDRFFTTLGLRTFVAKAWARTRRSLGVGASPVRISNPSLPSRALAPR